MHLKLLLLVSIVLGAQASASTKLCPSYNGCPTNQIVPSTNAVPCVDQPTGPADCSVCNQYCVKKCSSVALPSDKVRTSETTCTSNSNCDNCFITSCASQTLPTGEARTSDTACTSDTSCGNCFGKKCSAQTAPTGLTLLPTTGNNKLPEWCTSTTNCDNCFGKLCSSKAVPTNYVRDPSPSADEWCTSTTDCGNCFVPTCATLTCPSEFRLFHSSQLCDKKTQLCDESDCCEVCARIHVDTHGNGLTPTYNGNGEYVMIGMLNGKPYYRKTGGGNSKQLFLYFAPAKTTGVPTWFLSRILGDDDTANAVNYLAQDIFLPLSDTINTWSGKGWSMGLECKSKKKDEGTCNLAENGGSSPKNCHGKGKGWFKKSVNGLIHGSSSALCCEHCEGFFVTLKSGESWPLGFDFGGVYDTVGVTPEHNSQWQYIRQDDAVKLYFDDEQQWCFESVSDPTKKICAESGEDGPDFVNFPFNWECLTPAPIRHAQNCDGRWKDEGKCTVPCMLDGEHGGVQLQRFYVERPANYRGAACLAKDHTTRTIACHERPCPDDCIGRWLPELDGSTPTPKVVCSKPCGWGVTHMTYEVRKPATGQGHDCEHRHGKVITKPCFAGKCAGAASSSSSTTVAAP